jgi:hypothetical protein
MAGLTVVGDIEVLYDAVRTLEQKLKSEQESYNKNYEAILADIVERLRKLEAVCFEGVVLQEDDTSWGVIRAKRNYLLKSTDWTAVSGCTAAPMAWVQYRQELRDLPQKFATAELNQIVWPVQPPTHGPHTVEEEEI